MTTVPRSDISVDDGDCAVFNVELSIEQFLRVPRTPRGTTLRQSEVDLRPRLLSEKFYETARRKKCPVAVRVAPGEHLLSLLCSIASIYMLRERDKICTCSISYLGLKQLADSRNYWRRCMVHESKKDSCIGDLFILRETGFSEFSKFSAASQSKKNRMQGISANLLKYFL